MKFLTRLILMNFCFLHLSFRNLRGKYLGFNFILLLLLFCSNVSLGLDEVVEKKQDIEQAKYKIKKDRPQSAILIKTKNNNNNDTNNSNNNKEQMISHFINKEMPNVNVGFILQDLKTGKIIYSKNEHNLFTPASVTKLFTASAALIELGADFRFNTSLYISPQDSSCFIFGKKGFSQKEKKSQTIGASNKGVSKKINSLNNKVAKNYGYNQKNLHVLNGDLFVRFTGDPSFTNQKLHKLIKQLKENNIHEIKGDIIIDDFIFQGSNFAYGWAWESNQWFFASPISASMVNGNTLRINLSAGKQLGEILTAKYLPPKINSMKLKSKVKAVTFEDSKKKCNLVIDTDQNNNYSLSGCWPIKDTQSTLKLAIFNPRNYIKSLIVKYLEHEKIKFNGNFLFKKTPANYVQVANIKSEKLDTFLKKILSESDNIYTEAITKTLGARLYGVGNFKTGVLAINKILSKKIGIDFKALKLLDGSGLSRYNLISPYALNSLLYSMHSNKIVKDAFVKNLSWLNMKGTLEDRAVSSEVKQNVIAKTGTISGVSALSGYIKTYSNKHLAFTIMINGYNDKMKKAKNFENSLCQMIINQI